jgi:hypothetical protein
LTAPGWATIELSAPSWRVQVRRVSYVSDALGDFIRGVTSVVSNVTASASVTWNHEPGTTVLTITRAGLEHLGLVVGERGAYTTTTGPSVGSIKDGAFVRAVLNGCGALSRERYAERWNQFPYPEMDLARLRELSPQ